MCVQDADLSLPLFMGVDGMADYMFVVDNGELRVLFSLTFVFFSKTRSFVNATGPTAKPT